MGMTKKYAICEVHTLTCKYIQLLNYDEYRATTCYVKVIEESDDYDYIRNLYNEKYDNRYVTGEWLRNNGYLVEDVSTFTGAGKRYTNKIKNIKVEIVLVNGVEGYQLSLRNHGRRMEYTDNLWYLTIDKFNTLLSIFD